MKTQYYTAASLDGFIATEDDSLDWLFPLGDVNETSYPQFIAEVGALAMGSATYEWMLRHAVKVEEDSDASGRTRSPRGSFPAATCRTSRARTSASCAATSGRCTRRCARPPEARKLWVVGGGDLAGQFHDAGLLDEIIVQVGSVTLGRGKPLFPRRLTSPPLRLVGGAADRQRFRGTALRGAEGVGSVRGRPTCSSVGPACRPPAIPSAAAAASSRRGSRVPIAPSAPSAIAATAAPSHTFSVRRPACSTPSAAPKRWS